MDEYTPDCEGVGIAVNEFVAKDSVVAVAAPDKHTDTVWFIMVTSNKMTMNKLIIDEYGNTIAAGQANFTGQFLEQTTNQTVYVLSNKNHTSLKKVLFIPLFKLYLIKKASL